MKFDVRLNKDTNRYVYKMTDNAGNTLSIEIASEFEDSLYSLHGITFPKWFKKYSEIFVECRKGKEPQSFKLVLSLTESVNDFGIIVFNFTQDVIPLEKDVDGTIQ